MATEQVNIDLIISTAESAKTLGEVKNSIRDINKALLDTKTGTAEFNKLQDALTGAREKVRNTKKEFDILNQAVGFAKNLAAGFGIATSAIGLFTDGNKEMEKSLLKVQSALTLVTSITAFADGLKKAKESSDLLKLSLLSNPIFIIATALAAAAAAMFLFGDSTDDATKSVDNLEQSIYDLRQTLFASDFSEGVKSLFENFDKLKDSGASATELRLELEKINKALLEGKGLGQTIADINIEIGNVKEDIITIREAIDELPNSSEKFNRILNSTGTLAGLLSREFEKTKTETNKTGDAAKALSEVIKVLQADETALLNVKDKQKKAQEDINERIEEEKRIRQEIKELILQSAIQTNQAYASALSAFFYFIEQIDKNVEDSFKSTEEIDNLTNEINNKKIEGLNIGDSEIQLAKLKLETTKEQLELSESILKNTLKDISNNTENIELKDEISNILTSIENKEQRILILRAQQQLLNQEIARYEDAKAEIYKKRQEDFENLQKRINDINSKQYKEEKNKIEESTRLEIGRLEVEESNAKTRRLLYSETLKFYEKQDAAINNANKGVEVATDNYKKFIEQLSKEPIPTKEFYKFFDSLIDKSKWDNTLAEINTYIQNIGSVVSKTGDLINADIEEQSRQRIELWQAEANAANDILAERLKQDAITQNEYDTQKEANDRNLRRRIAKEEKKQFQAKKATSIANAVISTALSVVNMLAQAPWPSNLVFAALAGALGAAEIAIIAKEKPPQELAKGGVFEAAGGGVVRGPGSGTSDDVNAKLSNGESVINARSTNMFAPLLSAINEIGGGVAFNSQRSIVTDNNSVPANKNENTTNLAVSVSISEEEVSRVQNKAIKIKNRAEL